jgi:hypothetical protein
MTIKIKVYSDPGHAWGAVKRKVLDKLGITKSITEYSYQKGGTVYLEEDLDLGTLITTLRDQDIDFKVIEKNHTNRYSPIRNYERFRA